MHYDYHLPPRSVIEGRIHYSGSETFKADYFHSLLDLVCTVNLIFLNFHKPQPQSVYLKDTFPHIRSKLCSRLRRVRSLNFLFRYFFFVSRMSFCVLPWELRRGQKKPHWDALADIGWYVLRKMSKNPIKPIDCRETEVKKQQKKTEMTHVLCLTCLRKEILQAPVEISSDDMWQYERSHPRWLTFRELSESAAAPRGFTEICIEFWHCFQQRQAAFFPWQNPENKLLSRKHTRQKQIEIRWWTKWEHLAAIKNQIYPSGAVRDQRHGL